MAAGFFLRPFFCHEMLLPCICLYKSKKGSVSMKRRQNKSRTHSAVRTGVLGAAISVIVLLAVCGLGALSISMEWLPESASVVFAPLAVGLAALLGPLPMIRQIGRRPLPIAYGYMVGLLVILLLLRTILWSGSDFGGWSVPLCAVAGSTAAGLLGGQRKVKRH